MNIMLSLGDATAKIIRSLKSVSDDLDCMYYETVKDFTQDAELRHLAFSRVVFSKKFIRNGEDDFKLLNEFISNVSNGTELVMLIQEGDKTSEGLFLKYFTSPMHSCAISNGSISVDLFKELATMSMPELKAKYYTLDKGSSQTVTAKSVDVKMSPLRGGSKKSSESEESSAEQSNVPEPSSNTESLPINTANEFYPTYVSEEASNIGDDTESQNFAPEDLDENIPSENDVVVSGSSTDRIVEDFSEEEEDDLLSVGNFGFSHSDTGMFDEDDLDEDLSLNESQQDVQEQTVIPESHKEEEYIAPVEPELTAPEPVYQRRGTPEYPYSGSKINLILSSRSSIAPQQVIDDAVRMAESGLRVLIIDMDFKTNNILSFINAEEFYNKASFDYSISDVYCEDGVYVLSAGYGCIPTKSEIYLVLSSCMSRGYDVVIVDCPIDSIQNIPLGILKGSNVIVVSGSDPSQIIETSIALTNRNMFSLDMERFISSNCKSILIGGRNELVGDTLSKLFFANGCWVK